MKYNKALNHWLQTPSSQPKVAAGFIVKVATCRHHAYMSLFEFKEWPCHYDIFAPVMLARLLVACQI